MIEIELYRAHIGLHALKCYKPKRKRKTDDELIYEYITGSIGTEINSVLCVAAWTIYFLLVLYFAVISLCFIVESRNYREMNIMSSMYIITFSVFPFCTVYLKTGFSILIFRFLICYAQRFNFNHNLKKRHRRVSSYMGYLFILLNFLLITIVNPSLLNPGPAPNLTTYFQNVQGFINLKDINDPNAPLNMSKILEFQAYVYSNKPKIIALNETWLKPSILDNEILPADAYKIFRVDRSQHTHPFDPDNPYRYRKNGGGVLIAVRSDLEVTSKIIKLKCKAEILTVQISTNDKSNIYFCTCYRVGTLGNENLQEVDTYLRSLYNLNKKRTRLFVVGDFNMSKTNWLSSTSTCMIEQNFVNLFNDLGLSQMILEPTHVHGNTLDLLLTNNQQSISNLTVHDNGSAVHSDHFPLTFCINLVVKRKKAVKRKIFNYKRANWNDLNNDLRHTNWNDLLLGKSTEQAWQIFKSQLDLLCRKYIPVITIKSEFQPPWFDSDCYNLCREKEKWRSKFKRSKNDEHYFKFSKCRSDFKKLAQQKMRDNFSPDSDTLTITKKFWSHVKSTSNSHRIPESVYYGRYIRSVRRDQCDIFNQFFYNQFSDPSLYNINIDFSNDPYNDFVIDHARVRKLLLKINTNKAQGPDKIHGKILKECALGLAYPISILFNASFKSSEIPNEWKSANVVPIHKKNCKNNVENYRPISLTCIIMKIFERIIRDELYSKCSHLIDPRQHGFLPKKSCNTQLVDFSDNLTLAAIKGNESDIIYFDFSKAFDSVNHDILLDKLKHNFKVDGLILKFIVNYLKGRKQRVVIGNSESDNLDVLSGVPQGSILGPLLFVLFINDLTDGISDQTNIAMYADDTKIWRQIYSIEDCYALQCDVDYMQNWAIRNKMNFHPKKCKVLNISLKNKSIYDYALPFSQFFYSLGENILDFTDSENDLGLLVTRKLNWTEHCNKLYNKACMMLGLTRRTAHFINNEKQRRILYLTLVRSQFEHCAIVWRPSAKSSINRLESLQKRSIKWIMSEEMCSYPPEIYFQKCKALDILPLEYYFILKDILFLYEVINNNSPVQLPPYLTFFNGSRLRNSHLDSLSLVSSILPNNSSFVAYSNLFSKSFFLRSYCLWNDIPLCIREISGYSDFKDKLTKYIWEKARFKFLDESLGDTDISDDGG